MLIFLERAGRIVFANAEARQAMGLAPDESIHRPVEDALWGLFPGTAEPQTLLTGSSKGSPFHATLLARSGRMLPVEGTYCSLNSTLREAVIVAHPGGRERAPKSRLIEDVLASIPEAVAIVHGGNVLYSNPAFTAMFGYTADEVNGENLRDLIVPETRLHENEAINRAVDQDGIAQLETVRKTKDGELVDVSLLAGPLVVNGTKLGYALTYRDIGQRKQAEAKVQLDSMHDILTGLPNRALFLDRLNQALARRKRRRDQSCALLLIELDKFQEINESLGHAAGDMLLVAVAGRLSKALRPQDTAARLGAEGFAVLVEDILTISDLSALTARVSRDLERPFEVYGHSVYLGASIGVAMAGAEHVSSELLVRDADIAAYRAKHAGGGRFEIFDANVKVHVTNQQERERELRQVLEKRAYEIWYQPIYRLSSGQIEGFESLLRWRRSDGSVDSFRDLLPLAEDTGLSISIGRVTAETVCRQLRAWMDASPARQPLLTINVTHRQFFHPDLHAQLNKVLAATGVDPTRLLFEVAETTLNENPDAAVAILQRLVDRNVRIAVDNFGSALAPINHLVRLPIDVVKLDPKLTAAATLPGRQSAILETVLQLGRSLGVQVIAQGIETSQQLDALLRLGCELGQGFLLSGAVDPARAHTMLGLSSWPVASSS